MKTCSRCQGSGELYRLYDKEEGRVITMKSSEFQDKVGKDRYRTPKEGDGDLTHPYPTCPRCDGRGKVE